MRESIRLINPNIDTENCIAELGIDEARKREVPVEAEDAKALSRLFKKVRHLLSAYNWSVRFWECWGLF
jgi:hypothetical protein